LSEKQEKLTALQTRWEAERSELNKIGELKTKLDAARVEADKAQREANLELASRLLYGEIPQLEKQLKAAESQDGEKRDRMVGEMVSEDEIAAVVSAWTGIPTLKTNLVSA
jgi:ATP-dependent Clp protease ATP-binding subunit ClpB